MPRRRLVVRPALSVAVAHFAVLGRQYRSRPLHRRARAADDAGVHPLGRRVSRSCCRSPPRHLVRDWPTIRKHAGLLTLLALTGFSVYNTLAYYGLQYTTAINGLLLQSVAPLFVALWSFVLFRDRLTLRQAGGICVSLTGVVVIICHGSLDILLAIAFNRGDICVCDRAADLWILCGDAAQAAAMHPLSFLAVGMGWRRAVAHPGGDFGDRQRPQTMVLDAESVASFAFICIFPSLLGYLFLNRGIELIGANRAAPFIHLVPVFGSVLAIVLLRRALRALSRHRLCARLRRDYDRDEEVTVVKTSAA